MPSLQKGIETIEHYSTPVVSKINQRVIEPVVNRVDNGVNAVEDLVHKVRDFSYVADVASARR